ncbi:MAG: ABC transporter permease subunit, partial [Clostridia bacterium]|nr:ABC transporter permease subunit [Clostridia bacterium]
MMKRNSSVKSAAFSTPVKISVALILAALVILPIIRMFAGVRLSDFQTVFASPLFEEALKNSVVLSLLATAISVLLAYALALCTVRASVPGKRIFSVLLTLPMLIPSISHGIGLTTLFGNNGIFTQLFGTPSIYGSVGIVAGSVMYAFPVAYIMLSDVLTYEDMSVYEAANVLGIGKVRQFLRLSLPYLRRPLIATAFSTFSLIVTDYGVPVLIGGQTYTLSSLMYTEIAAATGGSFGKSTVYALFLLIPAIVAFVTDALNKEKGATAFVKRSAAGKTSKLVRGIALAVCLVVSCVAILPILSFAVQAFVVAYPRDMTPTLAQVKYMMRQRGLEYLANSLVIALATALLGTVLSYVTAYLTARMRSPLSRLIHLLALTFMAIPGLVLGLSYAMTFKETLIYGTVAIMIMAN